MGKSTAKLGAGKVKPEKPYPEFPLFAHATNRWAKKIRGKLVYFGPWADPEAALHKYLDQKDDLHAGRTPRTEGGGLTIRDLCNRFLMSKRRIVETGELTHRSYVDYNAATDRIVACFGRTRLVDDLVADDFEQLRTMLAKGRGPTSLAGDVQRVRTIFKYAYEAGLIDRPVRHGPTFKRPGKAVLRKAKAARGDWTFEAKQICDMIDAAKPQLKAMILLGINCGMGNTDCSGLRERNIDLDGGWLDYPRPKTGIGRRCPLWPETVKAIRKAIDVRPNAADKADADRVFLTYTGRAWVRDADINGGGKLRREADSLAESFRTLSRAVGTNQHRRGFYALRHTFETIAGDTTDQVAVDLIMGHSDPSMAATYRHRIDDKRLQKVVGHVHRWLFAEVSKEVQSESNG